MKKDESKKPELEQITAVYSQDADCCDTSDRTQEMEISTHDGGGGKYFTIKTERWAFENEEELIQLISNFIKKIS